MYNIYINGRWIWICSNDCNNWNYNPFINTPNADSYNNKHANNISGNNSYNFMKYNCVIMLKDILKHTNHYSNDDIKEWIFKKALQGSKNDYITSNLFYYYLFWTDETINYKKFVYRSVKIPYILERAERPRERLLWKHIYTARE